MRRYESEYGVNEIKLESGRRRLSTRYYPIIEEKEGDFYIMSKRGMRWDNLAYQYYNNHSLWFILARANNSANGSLLVPSGVRIRIPSLGVDDIEELFLD